MPSITSNTSIVINGVPRALAGGFYLNGVKILESATGFTYVFDGTAYTDVNGDRYLENVSGTQDIKLVSGRGLEFNGVDQYIELNGYVNQLIYFKDGVFTVDVIDSVLSGYQFGVNNGGNGIVISGVVNTFIASPIEFDAATLEQIRLNPERTVYLENGVLKSDILPQATLDSMAASNGFAYLMTENESCNGYLRNLATSDSLALLDNVSSDWIAGRGKSTITYDADGVIATKSTTTTFAPAIQLSGIEAFKPIVIELEIENPNNMLVYPRAGDSQEIKSGGVVTLITQTNESYINVLGSFTPDVDYLWVGLVVVGGSTGQSVKITKCRAFYLTDNYYQPVENWSSTMHTNVADQSHGIQTALLDQDSFGVPTGLATIDVQATDFTDAQTQFSSENGLTLTDNAGTWELTK
jgi:hypothetical protein